MAIVILNRNVFKIRFKAHDGVHTATVRLLRQQGDIISFEYVKDGGLSILIAHPKDILKITVDTWDNVEKKEGTRNISFNELIAHFKSCEK
jgi:hypothetical protein